MKKEKRKAVLFDENADVLYLDCIYPVDLRLFQFFFFLRFAPKRQRSKRVREARWSKSDLRLKFYMTRYLRWGRGFKRPVRGEILFPFRFGTGFRIQPLQ